MKVLRKTIAGIGMTAAATAALLAVTPAANAATNKQVVVFVHSYTNSVRVVFDACAESNCKKGDTCIPLPSHNTATWIPISLAVQSGYTLRGLAYNDRNCRSDVTQASPVLTVPNDNSSEFRIDLN